MKKKKNLTDEEVHVGFASKCAVILPHAKFHMGFCTLVLGLSRVLPYIYEACLFLGHKSE